MGSESAGVGFRAFGRIKMKADGGRGAIKVDENDIIGVVREYLEDKENSYALMLTGEGMWENLLRRTYTDREAREG